VQQDREDLLRHYRRQRDALLAAIEGLDDAALSETGPDGWSVKDQLAHLALWDDVRAAEVERISAGHESAWRMTPEQDEQYNRLGLALRRNLVPSQVKWELAVSRQRLINAISSADPRALDTSHYGEAGLRSNHEQEHAEWIIRWRQERGL
jgi:uncharacterized damage-inducible protein DinB